MLLSKKEFSYNLKGQSPKHTRRGFLGFCFKKNFLFSLDETEKIVKVNVNVIVEQNGFLSLEQTEVFADEGSKLL